MGDCFLQKIKEMNVTLDSYFHNFMNENKTELPKNGSTSESVWKKKLFESPKPVIFVNRSQSLSNDFQLKDHNYSPDIKSNIFKSSKNDTLSSSFNSRKNSIFFITKDDNLYDLDSKSRRKFSSIEDESSMRKLKTSNFENKKAVNLFNKTFEMSKAENYQIMNGHIFEKNPNNNKKRVIFSEISNQKIEYEASIFQNTLDNINKETNLEQNLYSENRSRLSNASNISNFSNLSRKSDLTSIFNSKLVLNNKSNLKSSILKSKKDEPNIEKMDLDLEAPTIEDNLSGEYSPCKHSPLCDNTITPRFSLISEFDFVNFGNNFMSKYTKDFSISNLKGDKEFLELKRKKRENKTTPLINKFTPSYNSRQSINRKILKKFRNYLCVVLNKISINDENIDKNFWLNFVKETNFIPPFRFYDESTNKLEEFTSVNSFYLVWLLNKRGAIEFYYSFIRDYGESLLLDILPDKELKNETTVKQLIDYLRDWPIIFNQSFVNSNRKKSKSNMKILKLLIQKKELRDIINQSKLKAKLKLKKNKISGIEADRIINEEIKGKKIRIRKIRNKYNRNKNIRNEIIRIEDNIIIGQNREINLVESIGSMSKPKFRDEDNFYLIPEMVETVINQNSNKTFENRIVFNKDDLKIDLRSISDYSLDERKEFKEVEIDDFFFI